MLLNDGRKDSPATISPTSKCRVSTTLINDGQKDSFATISPSHNSVVRGIYNVYLMIIQVYIQCTINIVTKITNIGYTIKLFTNYLQTEHSLQIISVVLNIVTSIYI